MTQAEGHLTPDGYRDLALITDDNIQAARVGDTASVSGSCSLGQKRRTPESIVTRAPAPPPKRGRGVAPARIAGWLVGRRDADPGCRGGRGGGGN
jgi:hypothetical protein